MSLFVHNQGKGESTMAWGSDPTIQAHYRGGREVQEVLKSQVDGVCRCGYITLAPANDFERHNGGLTVKRSQVRIVDAQGREVKQLRGVQRWWSCNACANNWR
jgi:hypothetical protein